MTIDALMCGAVFFISPASTILWTFYAYFLPFSVIGLLFVLFGKKLYDKNKQRTDTFRKVTAAIRLAIYLVVIISFSIPFSFFVLSDKQTYPMRKAMFLSHYHKDNVRYSIMPEHLPDRTDDLSIHLHNGFGPSSGGMDIFYYTDSGIIKDYKRTAEEYGAEYYAYSPEDELTDENDSYINKDKVKFIRLIEAMRNTGASEDDIQNAEIYIFAEGYERTFAWILNEKTGYFRAHS